MAIIQSAQAYTEMKQIMLLFICTLIMSTSGFAETLTFYSNRADLVEHGEFARWANEFKKRNTKIDVQVIALERYNQEMNVRISRGDYGDVLLIPGNLPAMAWSSYFVPLNQLTAKNELYFSNNWEYLNKVYGLPLGVNVEGLIYNKSVFAKARLPEPTTLSELYSVAKELKKAGHTALALNIGSAWPLQQWDKAALLIAGKGNYFQQVAREDDPFNVQKPYGKSLAIARTFYNEGYSEKNITRDNWQKSKQEFSEGKVAMLFMGSWVIPQLLEAGVKAKDIGFIPFPVDDSHKPAAVLNVDWGVAVSKKSKKQTAALAWLNYLLFDSDFADVSGYLPAVKSRQSGMMQLQTFMQNQPRLIQMARHDDEFLRLANKAGLDFYQGNSVRNILINPDFDFTLQYWNKKWKLARSDVSDVGELKQ